MLADCFPKIMVNILPYFALSGQDARVAQQRETAHRVYGLLKEPSCLGKQVSRAADSAAAWMSCASHVCLGLFSVAASALVTAERNFIHEIST